MSIAVKYGFSVINKLPFSKFQNELELLSVEPAVKDMGDRGMSEWHRDGGDGSGDNGGSWGNVLNSGHRGAEDRGGNCGSVEDGCSNLGGNCGSVEDGCGNLGECSSMEKGLIGKMGCGGNSNGCRGSLDEGCCNLGKCSNGGGESNLGSYSNRGSDAGNRCRYYNWSRGCGGNGIDETILIQIFTESFKGERPEAFGGCNCVTNDWGSGTSLGSLVDGVDNSLRGGACSGQEGSEDSL